MEALIDFISDFNILFSAILALVFIWSVRSRRADKGLLYFTFLLTSMAVVQLGMEAVKYLKPVSNTLYFFFYYMTLEFIFASLFFYEQLKSRKIVYLIFPVVAFIVFQYLQNPELYYRYNPLGILITRLLLLTYSLLFMYRCLSSSNVFSWINVGYFAYWITSTLIFISGNLIFEGEFGEQLANLMIDTNAVIYLLLQLLILVVWNKHFSRPAMNSSPLA